MPSLLVEFTGRKFIIDAGYCRNGFTSISDSNIDIISAKISATSVSIIKAARYLLLLKDELVNSDALKSQASML